MPQLFRLVSSILCAALSIIRPWILFKAQQKNIAILSTFHFSNLFLIPGRAAAVYAAALFFIHGPRARDPMNEM